MSRLYQTRRQNPDGLYRRYRVGKIYEEPDPRAVYVVLRIDPDGRDKGWIAACRLATRQLAQTLQANPSNARLRRIGDELIGLLNKAARNET